MNSKNLLDKILNLLAVSKEDAVELNRISVYGRKLPGNEILETAEWKLGVPVFVISEDGSKKPLEDGDHEVVIEDVADGRADGGPTKYSLSIAKGIVTSLQLKQLRETKSITNKTQLEKTETMELGSMEEKAMVPETKSPEKEEMAEPLKDLGPEEKYATKAEIEDIKKSIADLTKALESLMKEGEGEQDLGSMEKTAKVPETKTPQKEELGSTEKSVSVPETKVPGKKVKMSSARALTGAPEAAKPAYDEFFNKEKSFESTRDRVWRRMNS